MAFRSRLASLTAAAALALPAAALIAALPGTAAEAAPACNAEQAAITFVNGSTHCQGYGRVTYIALREGDKVRNICAGHLTLAEVFPYGAVTRPVLPGKCEMVSLAHSEIVVAAIAF